jgi:hypothetical protein
MAGVSVIDGFPKVSLQAAFLVAFLVELAIRATYGVTMAVVGPLSCGLQGWDSSSSVHTTEILVMYELFKANRRSLSWEMPTDSHRWSNMVCFGTNLSHTTS